MFFLGRFPGKSGAREHVAVVGVYGSVRWRCGVNPASGLRSVACALNSGLRTSWCAPGTGSRTHFDQARSRAEPVLLAVLSVPSAETNPPERFFLLGFQGGGCPEGVEDAPSSTIPLLNIPPHQRKLPMRIRIACDKESATGRLRSLFVRRNKTTVHKPSRGLTVHLLV
jgi:hypothetical protein